MGVLHLKAGEYSVSLSYSVLRTDKYHKRKGTCATFARNW